MVIIPIISFMTQRGAVTIFEYNQIRDAIYFQFSLGSHLVRMCRRI